MATPAKSNAANANPGATPTQITSSPYPAPSAVPMGRPLSHISPSTRTPSHQQGQHHHHQGQQHPPASSHSQPPTHQYTPMLDDAAAFSSPSALLALGLSGITPSPGPGGIGMTAGLSMGVGMGLSMSDAMGMNMGMQLDLPMHSIPGNTAKDTEAEKRRNMAEVLSMLRTRVAGRGVCREAIERLGTLEGFECMWEENNLSIAGNSVDLEIEFGHRHSVDADVVRDVTLRYATREMAEGEKREAASAVLRGTLTTDGEIGEWKKVGAFHANLTRLARLDGLSREVNCFEAVEGVHESMMKVWNTTSEETRFWERLCRSTVGCPTMHRGENVGLAIQYWVDQRRFLDAQHTSLDEVFASAARGEKGRRQLYNAVIECESGYPSLRISKGWVGDPTLLQADNDNNNTAGETNNGNESKTSRTNWTEPQPTLVSTDPLLPSSPPNVRFVARLEPAVHVPIVVAAEIYRLVGITLPQETRPAAFDGLVVPVERRTKPGGEQHVREVTTFVNDEAVGKKHVYTFYALEHVPGFTVRELPFSHPRQVEDVIPILRQYAQLGSLLDVFDHASPATATDTDTNTTEDTFTSNADAAETRLTSLLSNSTAQTGETRVSISLRTPVSSPPCLLIVFPLPAPFLCTVSITIEVKSDGRLHVPSTGGLVERSPAQNTRAAQAQPGAEEEKKVCGLIERVLETSEDLGLLVEWVIKYMNRAR
ncbi:hypothetical protein FQN49_003814 [Arthroderma sp. PD_2]|nr:hypothetical protein FQN49_003814 [Arthroderma sp. PD_2]